MTKLLLKGGCMVMAKSEREPIVELQLLRAIPERYFPSKVDTKFAIIFVEWKRIEMVPDFHDELTIRSHGPV